jgi:NAD(P)-dependent dehydrogenase (short-subunit alcohol dehydrogenase family)
MLASRAALAQFRSQGSGVLINVSSLLAFLPAPVLPAYVMSKFATSGLTLSLHAAARRTPGIDVCLVEPGPVDTPMFARAANHTGRELRALPTACSPARAAAVIVGCARRPRRRVVIGWSGRVISAAHHVAPATTERVAGAAISRLIVRSTAEAPSSNGLFEWRDRPVVVDGGWRRNRVRRALGDAVGRAVVARVGRDRRAHADEPVGRR